jgi:hypothetical protein
MSIARLEETPMREQFGDLWDFHRQPNAVACITTNGFVKKNGECVMGRGCAKEARDKFQGLAGLLGGRILTKGNHVHLLPRALVSFPTKHVWWEKSDLKLIEQSARELKVLAVAQPDVTFYLPRPGCANGQLDWADVKPVLESVGLPDNVVAITREGQC